jgi:hypothetical protein
MQQQLPEIMRPLLAAEPKSYSGAAAADKYVSLKLYTNCMIVITTGAWAAGTVAVTLKQATTVAGAGAKALAFTDYWDDETTSGILVKKAAASNTFNLATAQKTYVIEVDARMLDEAGGFDCITFAGASPGANADFYSVSYTMHGSRYQGAASSLTNPLVD